MPEGTVWNNHPEWGPPGTPYYDQKLAELEEKKAQAERRKAASAKRKQAKDEAPTLV